MIYYTVLISYACVTVLADTIDMSEYIEQFRITNELMENASNTFGDHGKLNGLAYTLKQIIRGDTYTMEELNFMFAIPDQADVLDLNKYIGYQRKMQNEITSALHVDGSSSNRTVLDWTEFGNKRRKITKNAIVQLFFNDIYRASWSNYSLKQKCHLIGLALSTNNPNDYTESVEMEDYNVCIINRGSGLRSRYKEFDNEFHEVSHGGASKKKHRFLDQFLLDV